MLFRALQLERLEHRTLLTMVVGRSSDDALLCRAVDPAAATAIPAQEAVVARELIMITHGWNSNVDDWPTRMQTNIAQRLRESDASRQIETLNWNENQGNLIHATPVGEPSAIWEIATFDWRTSAGTFLPTSAANNAATLGNKLSAPIINAAYTSIQIIAHSAGSALANALITAVEAAAPATFTHITFLDSYTPGNEATFYGSAADWSEHYVDKGVLPSTNASFNQALNLDLSLWGPSVSEDSITFGVAGHAWPWEWYLQTTSQPESSAWGFSQSIAYQPPDHHGLSRGMTLVLGQPGDSNDDGRFDSDDLIAVFVAGKFETQQPAQWFEGDWNLDGQFNTEDMIYVFQAGLYQTA